MRDPEKVLNTLCEHSNFSDYKYERLYRILFNDRMFYAAYQRIYAKQGNMTPGSDGRTIDQMSIQRIEDLIESLRNETYKPHPVKRVYIPKKNGGTRALGIPSFEDKLVQEVVRMILEAIYEGSFEDASHGFRPQRSCHTALARTQKTFTGTKWFIEGDIKGFFGNINHNVLIDTLRERISDERFLRLVRKFLGAGYIENWEYNNTYSGTPQGGIISPVLANIYLDRFDKYMKEYAVNFEKGKKGRMRADYHSLSDKVLRLKKKLTAEKDETARAILLERYRKVRKEMLGTPCRVEMDGEYRRLNYVRYADDFLIGVIGSKAECEEIKADIARFMREKLELELSNEKTLITHAQTAAQFLGYEISVRKSNDTKRNSKGIQRIFSGKVNLQVAARTARDRLISLDAMKIEQAHGKEVWKSVSRGYLASKTPEEILAKYNAQIRGFYNYYSMADNISAIGSSFGYVMEYSLYKTLAQKLNGTVRSVITKYRKDKDFTIPYQDSKGHTKYRTLYNGGFKKQTANRDAGVDIMASTRHLPSPELIERLKECRCELCGTEGRTVMHHIRNLNKLKPENEWERLMMDKRRKTLAVCERCNTKIQNSNKLG